LRHPAELLEAIGVFLFELRSFSEKKGELLRRTARQLPERADRAGGDGKHTFADAMLCFRRLSMAEMPIYAEKVSSRHARRRRKNSNGIGPTSELRTSWTWAFISSAWGLVRPRFTVVVSPFSGAVAASPRDMVAAESDVGFASDDQARG
jgi:hypothetical protein